VLLLCFHAQQFYPGWGLWGRNGSDLGWQVQPAWCWCCTIHHVHHAFSDSSWYRRFEHIQGLTWKYQPKTHMGGSGHEWRSSSLPGPTPTKKISLFKGILKHYRCQIPLLEPHSILSLSFVLASNILIVCEDSPTVRLLLKSYWRTKHQIPNIPAAWHLSL